MIGDDWEAKIMRVTQYCVQRFYCAITMIVFSAIVVVFGEYITSDCCLVVAISEW